MFDRKTYKMFAKKQLKGRWATPVLATLFIFFIMLLFEIPEYISMLKSPMIDEVAAITSFRDFLQFYKETATIVQPLSIRIFAYISLIVEIILSLAFIHLSLKMTESPTPVNFSTFIEGFSLWFRAIVAYLWNFIWVFLWALLFIIPGIIKGIAYSQMFYIVAEYPNISAPKAMRMSIVMTQGHKGELFVMYLSFIGWMLLCLLSLGIGFLWLVPYMQISLTNAYRAMKKMAVDSGILSVEDFQ